MFPSVTQVLSPFGDFSRVSPAVLEAAAERGIAVHRLCVGVARRLFVHVPPELSGYVASFKTWWPVVEELISAEEEMIEPRLGYVGHPDLVVRIRGDVGLTVVDLKTPVVLGKIWACQLAAYSRLVRAKYAHILVGPIRILSLRLRRDGSRPITNEFTDKQGRHFAAFCAALSAWRYFYGD